MTSTLSGPDAVDAWSINRTRQEAAITALARFVREGGDIHELLGRLTQTAARQIITAVEDMEAERPPVVRGAA